MRRTLNYMLMPLRSKNEVVYAQVDKADVPKVIRYTWTVQNGYARTMLEDGTTISMQRLILGMGKGNSGEYPQVDHIDRNKLNNRKSNLRIVTQGENNMNAYRAGRSGYMGVYQRSENSWRACLHANGKAYRSGGHRSAESAAQAYNALAMKHHGKFAVLNDVPMGKLELIPKLEDL